MSAFCGIYWAFQVFCDITSQGRSCDYPLKRYTEYRFPSNNHNFASTEFLAQFLVPGINSLLCDKQALSPIDSCWLPPSCVCHYFTMPFWFWVWFTRTIAGEGSGCLTPLKACMVPSDPMKCTQGALQRSRQKDCKSQSKEFAGRLCLLVMSEATSISFH